MKIKDNLFNYLPLGENFNIPTGHPVVPQKNEVDLLGQYKQYLERHKAQYSLSADEEAQLSRFFSIVFQLAESSQPYENITITCTTDLSAQIINDALLCFRGIYHKPLFINVDISGIEIDRHDTLSARTGSWDLDGSDKILALKYEEQARQYKKAHQPVNRHKI